MTSPSSSPMLDESAFQQDTTWHGLPVLKSPLDMWRYAELMWVTRPSCVIETGTFRGGSARFFADMLKLVSLGAPLTISIDIDQKMYYHSSGEVAYLHGDSRTPAMLQEVVNLRRQRPTMVVLDSDLSKLHVLAELVLYGKLVTPGQYLVVEDCSHPRFEEGGPLAAVEEWLPLHPDFERDLEIENRYPVTFHRGGWLRRKA